VDYVLSDGRRIAHTKVFKRFTTDGPPAVFHFDAIQENEAVIIGWRLLDPGSGKMEFDLKQGHCENHPDGFCTFDCPTLANTIIRSRLSYLKECTCRKDVPSSGADTISLNTADATDEKSDKPSEEEISSWVLWKQECYKYTCIDQFEELQKNPLKKGDTVATSYGTGKLLASGVIFSDGPVKRKNKRGGEEEQYNVKWDDVLAYDPSGKAGVWKTREQLLRIDARDVDILQPKTGDLTVRYQGSLNLYHGCRIVNFDRETGLYTVFFPDPENEETLDYVQRHWIATSEAALPFFVNNQAVLKVREQRKRKATAPSTNPGEDGERKSKRIRNVATDPSDDGENNQVDANTSDSSSEVGSSDDSTVGTDDCDRDSDYGGETSGKRKEASVDSDNESEDGQLQRLRKEWGDLGVTKLRKFEASRRSEYSILKELRSQKVKSLEWKFVNTNALTKEELENVLTAYDNILIASGQLKKSRGNPATYSKPKPGRKSADVADSQRVLFTYHQKLRLINVFLHPNISSKFTAELIQRTREQLDQKETGAKSSFWNLVHLEFSKKEMYNDVHPCCECHEGAYPSGIHANFVHAFDARKLYDEMGKIMNGYSKARAKIKTSGTNSSCMRESKPGGNFTFDDGKIEILYFSLRLKSLGTDGDSIGKACEMTMTPEAVFDSLADDVLVHDLPDGTPANKRLLHLSKASSCSSSCSSSSGGRGNSSTASISTAIKEGLSNLFHHLDKRRNPQQPPSPLTTPSPQSVMYGTIDHQEKLSNRRVNTVVRLRKRLGETLAEIRKFKGDYPQCMNSDSEYYEEYVLLLEQKETLSDALSKAKAVL
jgi:hypothetical protein